MKKYFLIIAVTILSSCSPATDESAPNLDTLTNIEARTLFSACYDWIKNRTDITNSLKGNGYPNKPSTFGTLLGANSYVKIFAGNDGRRTAEIRTTKIECRVLFTFHTQRAKELPKKLRIFFGQQFEEKGYKYAGQKKTGSFGFVQRWEAYQKDEALLLIEGTANLRDGDVTFRFANFKDFAQ